MPSFADWAITVYYVYHSVNHCCSIPTFGRARLLCGSLLKRPLLSKGRVICRGLGLRRRLNPLQGTGNCSCTTPVAATLRLLHVPAASLPCLALPPACCSRTRRSISSPGQMRPPYKRWLLSLDSICRAVCSLYACCSSSCTSLSRR